jgi:hypothetical protein
METQLKLRVCTWNVGNAPPTKDMRKWLGTNDGHFDIIAVGAQEANFKDSPVAADIRSPVQSPENAEAVASATADDIRDHLDQNPMAPPGGKLRKFKRSLLSRQTQGKVLSGTDTIDKVSLPRRDDRNKDHDTPVDRETSALVISPAGLQQGAIEPLRGSIRSQRGKTEPASVVREKPSSDSENISENSMTSIAAGARAREVTVSHAVSPTDIAETESSTLSHPQAHCTSTWNIQGVTGACMKGTYFAENDTSASQLSCSERKPHAHENVTSRSDITQAQGAVEEYLIPIMDSELFMRSPSKDMIMSIAETKEIHEARLVNTKFVRIAPTLTLPWTDKDDDGREDDAGSDKSLSDGTGSTPSPSKGDRGGYGTDSDITSEVSPDYTTETPVAWSPPRAATVGRRDTFSSHEEDRRRAMPNPLPSKAVSSKASPGTSVQRPKSRKGIENEDSPLSGESSRKFSKCVQNSVGPDYVLVAKHHLMEIKLLLFVHRRHRARVGKTEATTEATGLGNVVGNKGAVAVKLMLDDTSFCFVSSHLAAHEGAKFLQQRNDAVVEIMRNLEKNRRIGAPPALHRFHHIIWMGDLNYRLDLARGLPRAANWEHEVKWKHINNIVRSGQYTELTIFDELRGERELGNAFASFSEGPLAFPPTFKVVRGAPTSSYQMLRLPSYCDRIMWHSLPRHARQLTLIEYSSLEEYCTSDHKPVYAVFDLAIPKRARRFESIVPSSAIKCTVDILALRVQITDAARRAGTGGSGGGGPGGTLGGAGGVEDDSDDSSITGTGVARQVGSLPMADEIGGTSSDTPIGTGGGLTQAASTAGLSVPGNSHSMTDSPAGGTRRSLRIEYFGTGLFLRDRPMRTEVLLRGNGEVDAEELPTIPLTPVESLGDLLFRYMTIVVGGAGTRVACSCVFPIAELVERRGFHRMRTELELSQYGRRVGTVALEAELCISMECWIDSRNRVVQTNKWR